jgi:outer membrane protein OmpA-like peptidoglycan-associated protein
MTGRHLGSALSGVLAVLLAGCSGPIAVYHNFEGGAIAQARQAPPGQDLPYPNLADVPPAPPPMPANEQALINQQVQRSAPDVSPPSPGALAGLALPDAPPPLPDVPGLNLPAVPSTPAPPAPKMVAVAPPAPPSAPVSLGFAPGSAVLPPGEAPALAAIASARQGATVRVGGFGDGSSLPLALARAQRLADALTASGVPAKSIELVAMEAGSGGFVQLVY